MKIINKSSDEECSSEDSFYVLLSPEANDFWTGDDFRCETAMKYDTEEVAISHANPGMVVAKVTLVAKIV